MSTDVEEAVRFAVKCICCERDGGTYLFESWKEADAFREAYVSGSTVNVPGGHQRSAVIVEAS